jgi:UDP-N-acetylmuramyl pentapeptide phosphotransferase/UDP-N-acetylglucosamine-1-phosphate transferase
MQNRRVLVVLAVILGVALIAIGIVYWAEPAKSLPSFFPGHEAGSGHHHVKHGIAAFLLGLACLAFAWFNSGPKRGGAEPTPE